MTLALHGKTRARQCAFFGAALAAVVAAAVAGGVLPGAERSGAAAYSASSYAGSASSASGHWTNPANATGAQNGSGAITTTGGKVIALGTFNFGPVDGTALIAGVEVKIRGLASYAGAPLNVYLS